MVTSVELNGNTYNDGSTTDRYMGNGGHRTNFMLCLSDFLAEAATLIAATGLSLVGTSTTSLTVGTGTKSFTLAQTNKGFGATQRVRLARTSVPGTYMEGLLTSFVQGTGACVLEADRSAGSGTHTDWTMTCAGDVGDTGPSGLSATDISGATEATTLEVDDEFIIRQASSNALRRITANSLLNFFMAYVR